MTAVQTASNFETNSRRSRDVSEARTSRGRRGVRESTGRYDGQKARLLPTGVGRAASKNVRTAVAAVVDPFGNGIGRIQVTVNRRVDILESERSHGRLSEASYLIGRILQEKFERVGSVGGSNWLGVSKQDPMIQQELRILAAIVGAEDVNKTLARVRVRLGHLNTRLIQRVLGDRMTFAQCAEARGRDSERGTSFIAETFREALEDLADAWTAKGALQPPPDDKHSQAAEGAIDRQRRSIVKGVTMARRVTETREAARRAQMVRKVDPQRG